MSNQEQVEPTIIKLLEEIRQAARIRQTLAKQIEPHVQGQKVVYYFTSFRFPVMIEDSDADILEGLLQKLNLAPGLVLIINSLGGHGLASERIINVCRSYSNGKFQTIVPKMAKSAATMICLGSQEILMSDTSELGPIDPQVPYSGEGQQQTWLSLWSILQSYKELMRQAVRTKGNIDPFLQQLVRYDARLIKQWELESGLAADVAVQYLQAGMLADKKWSDDKIRESIKTLLDPLKTRSHGRPIYWQEVQRMGLKVKHVEKTSRMWQLVWELYIRGHHYVNRQAAKIIGCSEYEFEAGIPVREREET